MSKMLPLNLLGLFFVCLHVHVLEAKSCSANTLHSFFKNCDTTKDDFDVCMKKSLNAVTCKFPTGDSKYGIKPLDEIFVEEVITGGEVQGMNYTVRFLNNREGNWTQTEFLSFESNLKNYTVKYQQHFPLLGTEGDYEIDFDVDGGNYTISGLYSMKFYDYVITTTARAPPKIKGGKRTGKYGPIELQVVHEGARDVSFHFTNLADGNVGLEKAVNTLIDAFRMELFTVGKPLFDDFCSKMYTQAFNNRFEKFPFEDFF